MIKRSERSRKKYVTIIKGIEGYGRLSQRAFTIILIPHNTSPGVPLKVASKSISSKFACGSSITKSKTGQEEISIQGDISVQVKSYILSKWGDQVKNIRVGSLSFSRS